LGTSKKFIAFKNLYPKSAPSLVRFYFGPIGALFVMPVVYGAKEFIPLRI
jgi:hypothetical protein